MTEHETKSATAWRLWAQAARAAADSSDRADSELERAREHWQTDELQLAAWKDAAEAALHAADDAWTEAEAVQRAADIDKSPRIQAAADELHETATKRAERAAFVGRQCSYLQEDMQRGFRID